MNHLDPVTKPKGRPAPAASLLTKERQVGLLGDVLGLVLAAIGVAQEQFATVAMAKDLFGADER